MNCSRDELWEASVDLEMHARNWLMHPRDGAAKRAVRRACERLAALRARDAAEALEATAMDQAPAPPADPALGDQPMGPDPAPDEAPAPTYPWQKRADMR